MGVGVSAKGSGQAHAQPLALNAGKQDWEDAGSRMALLRAMRRAAHGDPLTSRGWFPGTASFGVMRREWVKTWRERMSEFFLFRERTRLRLMGKEGMGQQQEGGASSWADKSLVKPRHDSVIGLDFLGYMEVTMSQVLKTLVHITANGWLTLWLSFTVFLSVTRFLQSAWGWESNVARAVVYAGAQGTLLLTTMWLDSFLTRIRDNLCPRLSEQAHTILQEHEQGA